MLLNQMSRPAEREEVFNVQEIRFIEHGYIPLSYDRSVLHPTATLGGNERRQMRHIICR
jgi:hypothetical protein